MSVLSQFLLGSSKVKVRNPFSGDGLTKPGIRVGSMSRSIFTPNAFSASVLTPTSLASNGSVVVGVGFFQNGGSVSATTNAFSTTDCVNIVNRTISSDVHTDVIWTGTRFLTSCRDSGASRVSTDGATWSAGPSLPATNLRFFRLGSLLVAFTAAGGTAYYTSTDEGANWATRTFPVSIPNSQVALSCIASNPTAIIVVTNTGFAPLYRSTDGINWSLVTLPLPTGSGVQLTQTRVTSKDNGFAVCGLTGSSGAFISSYSADGLTWAPFTVSMPSGRDEYVSQPQGHGDSYGVSALRNVTMNMFSVTNVKGHAFKRFVVPVVVTEINSGGSVYNSCTVIHSYDGQEWTIEAPIASAFSSSIATTNASSIALTPDGSGIVFSAQPSPAQNAFILSRTDPNFRELVYEL